MSGAGATPLFVDTGPYYARFVSNAPLHERATAVFEGIRNGDLPYRPLYTSTYVLDELATLLVRRSTHTKATDALEAVRESSAFSILHPDPTDFEEACAQFARFDDHEIEFTDHMNGVLATDRAVGHVFTFDPDDFRPLGFRAVPDDPGGA